MQGNGGNLRAKNLEKISKGNPESSIEKAKNVEPGFRLERSDGPSRQSVRSSEREQKGTI
jgi:ribosomal protein S24E